MEIKMRRYRVRGFYTDKKKKVRPITISSYKPRTKEKRGERVNVIVPSPDGRGKIVQEEPVYSKENYLLTKHLDEYFNELVLAVYIKRDGTWTWFGKTFELDEEELAKKWIDGEVELRRQLIKS
jgi:hypothetical protein